MMLHRFHLVVSTAVLSYHHAASHPEWIPPGDGDVRSPCPGINTLANHGIIPRDGKNVPISLLHQQLSAIYPVSEDFLTIPIADAFENGLTHVDPNDGSIHLLTLDRLSEAKVMEHDASFFRQDAFFGDGVQASIDESLIVQLFEQHNRDTLSFDDILAFQTKRIKDSLKNNPEATFSEDDIFAMAEQATFLLVFGQDDDLESVPKNILREWMENERLHEEYVGPRDGFPKATFNGDISAEVHERFTANIEDIVNDWESTQQRTPAAAMWGSLIDLVYYLIDRIFGFWQGVYSLGLEYCSWC